MNRTATRATAILVAGAGTMLWLATPSLASVSPCTDGSTPTSGSTVTCTTAGSYTLNLPAGTATVDLTAIAGGGAGGYFTPGGNAAQVAGSSTLPAGTVALRVVVGVGGVITSGHAGTGGGGTAVFALGTGSTVLGTVGIAGAGGGGGYTGGHGGDVGSPGTANGSVNPAGAAVGAVAGLGGTPQTGISGLTGGDGTTTSGVTVGAGGAGAGTQGGSGGGGYAGGGGGADAGGQGTGGGGGGSSYVPTGYTSSIVAGSGGAAGMNGHIGTTGSVVLTIHAAVAPGAPTGVSAVAGNGSANVSFTAPASDGGSAITGYTVTSTPGGLTATCTASPCTITGLTNGTSYTFTVHATNTAGSSGESAASVAVIPATVPSAPTAPTAVAGDGSATVSFTAPSGNGGSAITGYTVTSAPGGLIGTCTTSPCTVTGLTNGTAYTFTVHATNVMGSSVESAASAAVTPVGDPGVPTGVSAVAGNGSATVTFTAPSSTGGATITSYTATSSPDGLSGTCTASPCTITGLTNGTAYTFTVHATNTAGSSAESTASVAVIPATVPTAPTAPTAVGGDGTATVSFTAPSSDGGSAIIGYTVTSAPGGLIGTCTTSPCTVTGLTNGTAYTFTVHATNVMGSSVESAASAAVTPVGDPGVPTGVSAVAGNGSATVTFTAPASDGGSAITGYTVTSTPGGLTGTCTASPCVITGLTNGTSYTFTVHATSAVGSSAESTASGAVVPAAVPTAPAAPTAVVSQGFVTVSWSASGSVGVTGYTVTASPGPATCTTAANVTQCVLGTETGQSYTYTVVANGTAGDSAASAASASVFAAAVVVPLTAPTSAPTTLTTTDGTLTSVSPSQTVTVVGTGFMPYSSIAVVIYSTPIVLAAPVADGAGDFTATVTIPADLAAGAHNLVAAGVDPQGLAHEIRMPVTLVAATSSTGTTSGSSGDLPFTGLPAVQLAVLAILFTATGIAFISVGRRRV